MEFWKRLFRDEQRASGAELRCQACGNSQRKGDWESAMNTQAKAVGARGFVNLGAEPQCLKCGSRELSDLSRPVVTEKEKPKIIKDAVAELVRLCTEVNTNYKRLRYKEAEEAQETLEVRIREIGQAAYDQGGEELMLKVHRSVANQCEYGRYLEGAWGGIGRWLG